MAGSRRRTLVSALLLAAGVVVGLAVVLTLRLGGDDAGPPPGLDLGTSAWALQPEGSPSIDEAPEAPSALFPAGVTYAQALRELVLAARQNGAVPSIATLADPLPPEVVIVRPDQPGEGLRLSLLARFGWTEDTRLIRPAGFVFPPSVATAEAVESLRALADPGTAFPEEIDVAVPRLIPCQIAMGDPSNRPACR